MATLKQSTAYTRLFKLVNSTDHVTAQTGVTATVTLSKAGGVFAAAAGVVSEVSSGWYKIALTVADTGTLGDLAYLITGASADDTDFVDQVTAQILGDTLTANATQLAGQTITAGAGVTFPASVASPTNITAATGIVLSGVTHTGAVVPTVSAVTGLTAANLDATISSRMATYTQPTGFLAATFPGTVASPTNITAATGIVLSGVTHTSAVIPTVTTVGTLTTYTGNTPQTGDAFARLGAPAGASVSADVAAVKTDTGTTIPGRLPAALTGAGNMKADTLALNGDAIAAATHAILNGANVVYRGTVTGAATTTTLIDSGLTQASTDWWKGRILIFTSVVTLQATDITGFDPTTDTLTFTALTTAPTGATYVII